MATYTNALIVYTSGRLQKIAAADTLTFEGSLSGLVDVSMTGALEVGGDANIGGNLNVQGAIVSHGSENLMVADPYIGLASNNESATATSGGFTLTLKKADGFTALTAETFVAGVPATSAPTVTLASGEGASLAAGDIIQISGAGNEVNNGLHVVQGVAGDVVTIYGIGGTAVPNYVKFIDNQFAAESGASAVVVKVDLAVIAISDGNLYQGASAFAAGTPCYAYYADAVLSDFDGGWSEFGGSVSLQDAYDAGNTIALADGSNLDVSKPSSGSAAISLQANAASKFEVVGAQLSLYTTTSGNIAISSAAQVGIDGPTGVVINSTGGTIDVGNGADNYAINIGTDGDRQITIGQPAGDHISLGTGVGNNHQFAVEVAGGAAIDAGDNSYWDVTEGDLRLSTITSGELDLTSAGLMDVNAGANLDIDVTGAVQIDATAASYIAVADADLSLDTGTGSVNIGNNSTGGVNIATTGARNAVIIGGADVNETYLDGAAVYVGNDSESPLVVVGNTVGASELRLLAGSGGITATGNVTLTGYLTATSYLKVGEVAFASFPTPAGAGGLLWDSTNSLLKFYDGSAWKAVADLSAVTLQLAYDNGNSIVLADGVALDVAPDAGATAAISLDANAASNFTVDGAELALSTTTSGELDLTSAGLMDVNAGANLDIDVTGSFDMLASGAFSIDGTGASNVSADSGSLTLSTSTSGDVVIDSAAAIDMDAVSMTLDVSGSMSLDAAGASNISVVDAALTIETVTSGALTLDSAGTVDIDAAASLSINTSLSGGAINIGNDDVAATINIGTAGARNVVIGSVSSINTSVYAGQGLLVQSLSSDVTITAATRLLATSADDTVLKVGGTSGAGLSVTNSANTELLSVETSRIAAKTFLSVDNFSGVGGVILMQNGVTTGQLVYWTATGVAAADNATNNELFGVAMEANSSGASTTKKVATAGSVMVQFDVGTAVTVGAPVYLSANAGKATQTVPTSGRVFKVGLLLSTTGVAGSYPVQLMPQFIADL